MADERCIKWRTARPKQARCGPVSRSRSCSCASLFGVGASSAPASGGSGPAISEFGGGLSAGVGLWGIAPGPDGNLWFTEERSAGWAGSRRRGDHRVPCRLPDGQPPRDRHRPRRQPLGRRGRRQRDREDHHGGRGDRVPGSRRAATPTTSRWARTTTSGTRSRRQPDRPHHADRRHHRVPAGHHRERPRATSRRAPTAPSGSPRRRRPGSAGSRPPASSPSSPAGITASSSRAGIAAGPGRQPLVHREAPTGRSAGSRRWRRHRVHRRPDRRSAHGDRRRAGRQPLVHGVQASGRIGQITTDGDITEYSNGLVEITEPVRASRPAPTGTCGSPGTATPVSSAGSRSRRSFATWPRTRSNHVRPPARQGPPNSQATEYSFEWGATAGYGNETPEHMRAALTT